jgi:hypothetical protein
VKRWVQRKGYSNRFLTSGEPLLRALGMLNEAHEDRISKPGTLIVDPLGRIVSFETSTVPAREPLRGILARLDELGARAASGSGARESADPLAPLGWLPGRWAATGPDSTTTETWRSEGSSLLGRSERIRGGAVEFWEDLRIDAVDGGLVYRASPMGGPAVPFQITVTPDGFTAANPAHDFPQLIVYRRAGTGLVAWIGATGQTEDQAAARWQLRPLPEPESDRP